MHKLLKYYAYKHKISTIRRALQLCINSTYNWKIDKGTLKTRTGQDNGKEIEVEEEKTELENTMKNIRMRCSTPVKFKLESYMNRKYRQR